jgi:hypothetical protein
VSPKSSPVIGGPMRAMTLSSIHCTIDLCSRRKWERGIKLFLSFIRNCPYGTSIAGK